VKAIKSDKAMSNKGRQFLRRRNRGDTAELATKKGRQIFQKKIEGVIPSVAAPGVTHPVTPLAAWQLKASHNRRHASSLLYRNQ